MTFRSDAKESHMRWLKYLLTAYVLLGVLMGGIFYLPVYTATAVAMYYAVWIVRFVFTSIFCRLKGG